VILGVVGLIGEYVIDIAPPLQDADDLSNIIISDTIEYKQRLNGDRPQPSAELVRRRPP
jgi:hypothetical protein